MSLIKIINTIQSLAENHADIGSFGYGFEFDIETQKESTQNYVQLFCQPINTQVNTGRNTSTNDRRFRLWAYDLVRQDELNKISVWNDCEAILIDIIRQLNYGSNDYKLINNPVLIPIYGRFGENVSGYFTEISVQTSESNGNCFVPSKIDEL